MEDVKSVLIGLAVMVAFVSIVLLICWYNINILMGILFLGGLYLIVGLAWIFGEIIKESIN